MAIPFDSFVVIELDREIVMVTFDKSVVLLDIVTVERNVVLLEFVIVLIKIVEVVLLVVVVVGGHLIIKIVINFGFICYILKLIQVRSDFDFFLIRSRTY